MKNTSRRSGLLASLAFIAALCAARTSFAQPAPAAASAPASASAPAPAAAPALTQAQKFEQVVLGFEAEDKANPPPKGAILLAGDSQFYRWKTLKEDLPDFTIINRGVDSFQFTQVLQYFDRTVLLYQPRMIILHVGGNDLTNNRTPEQILADLKTFVARVHAKQPNTPIAFTSITPSPGRWNQAEMRKQANKLIKDYVATQKNLHFIDLWDAMLTADGKPREDIWVEDRIHPNHEGYLIRVKIMRPLLGKPDKPAAR